MLRQIATIIILIVLGVLFWFSWQSYTIYHKPLVPKGVRLSFKIYPNDHLEQVTERLTQAGIIKHPEIFMSYVKLKGDRYHLRYGEYLITDKTTLSRLVKHMVKGTGLVRHRVMFVNGWTFANIKKALAESSALEHTLNNEDNLTIMKKVSGDAINPEGQFYPDTYFYIWGHDDLSVLKRAHEKMKRMLSRAWSKRAPGLVYKTPYEALIAASLVERETSIPAEKSLVSSVIFNRLKKGMRLQIDPTVQFGLGKSFGSRITKKDLRTKTPYNTYLNKGLPPTPICMPSRLSIEATLHPADTKYLFYVATGEGGHEFSKTYIEHKKAVKDYRKYEKQMQQNIDQLHVWWQQSIKIAATVVFVITYGPILENSLGLV